MSTPAPADTLRRAAALMRERAKAALESASRRTLTGTIYIRDGIMTVEETVSAFNFTPVVALAVADWLDAHSDACASCEPGICYALSVARAYLGDDAS